MALKRLNAELEAPDLLETDFDEVPDNSVEAMRKGLEEEKSREIHRVQLAERTRALVIFPGTPFAQREGASRPTVVPKPVPAKILSLAPAS